MATKKRKPLPDTRTCPKCQFTGDASLFISGKFICKDCNNERRRGRYKKNEEFRQKSLAINRDWRKENREIYRARKREYEARNKDAAKRRSEKFRTERAEYVALTKRLYHKANAEAVREKARQWKKANPLKRAANNQRRRALQKNAAGAAYTTAQHISWRWEMWGRRCWICGTAAEATDHVIPLCAGGSHWPSNLRPICQRCNSRRSKKRNAIIPPLAAEFIRACIEAIEESKQ